MKILWQGSRGPYVKELQSRLIELGFYAGLIDGIFGIATTQAVIYFQNTHKLFADGIAGLQTLSTLNLPVPKKMPTKVNVFVSYSHSDAKWLEMLQVHIAPLVRERIVTLWDDTKIEPGKKWQEEINNAINSSKVAVLLISPFFMASEFIAKNELPPLLASAENKGTIILPVVISPCVLGKLSEFQTVNPPTKPLVEMRRGDRDRVWVRVVETITAELNN